MSALLAPLRIGVCGTAHWAETVHLPALAEAPGLRLVGLYGRTPERVDALASQFGIVGFADFDAFLDGVDAVSFAVPPSVQAGLAPRALAAGRHVILEKPVAPSVVEAETIGAAVREAGVGAVCFLTRNFIPELLDFSARAVAAGVTEAEACFLSDALTPGSPYAASEWRQQRNATIWDVVPHLLTTLINILGPVEALALDRDDDGSLRADVGHAGGRRSRFVVNQRMPRGPLQETLIVRTLTGEMRLENLRYDRVAAFRRAAAQLLEAAAGNSAARAAFDDAVHLVRLLGAAEDSLETGGKLVCVSMSRGGS